MGGCDREAARAEAADGEAPASASAETPMAAAEAQSADNSPAEIYFDLTAFGWYREGRPLMHGGRSYMPQADPTPVEIELEEAGAYEGVTYYKPADAPDPVYTLYVPVYYRYWQRFTAPPGA